MYSLYFSGFIIANRIYADVDKISNPDIKKINWNCVTDIPAKRPLKFDITPTMREASIEDAKPISPLNAALKPR